MVVKDKWCGVRGVEGGRSVVCGENVVFFKNEIDLSVAVTGVFISNVWILAQYCVFQ